MKMILCTCGEEPNGALFLKPAYTAALRRCGAAALIPDFRCGEESADALLSRAEGLLLTGGGDLHPSFYGGEGLPLCTSVCEERDAFELALCRAAVARRIPLLAICRGVQVLNVALGGTLTPDIPGHTGGVAHAIRAAADSPLYPLFGAKTEVNSFHHQCADTVAPALQVAARAADGAVEALFLPGHPFCLGVQWHPERMENDPILPAFLGAVK